MGELLPSTPRPTGPRVVRVGNGEFQAVGLPEISPLFPTRGAAEGWLRPQLAKVPASRRPQMRRCMCCRAAFKSEGFHNRMCTPCRNVAANDDTSVYRVIRPSKRG